jgi:hypothetical protein
MRRSQILKRQADLEKRIEEIETGSTSPRIKERDILVGYTPCTKDVVAITRDQRAGRQKPESVMRCREDQSRREA